MPVKCRWSHRVRCLWSDRQAQATVRNGTVSPRRSGRGSLLARAGGMPVLTGTVRNGPQRSGRPSSLFLASSRIGSDMSTQNASSTSTRSRKVAGAPQPVELGAGAPLGRLYSVEDLAELTGLPKSTLYHFNSEGKGPKNPLKMGKQIRFFESEVRAWLKTFLSGSNESAA
ncbi:hypothetical protein C5E05_02530 [Pseudoclavibacter sp. AY1H1]|nr:hypothetical protein C5E05_02530 [Pseudoclavibacter sp. AY1H1]